MAEVHHRPAGGKGGNPSTARRALRRFVKAARALEAAWHPILEVPTYPRYLPPFDRLASDLADWHIEVEDRPYAELREVTPLDLADPAAVRAWISALRTQIGDATGAGEDALRPLGRRCLGRRTARCTLREASLAIEQLIASAERGIAGAAPG